MAKYVINNETFAGMWHVQIIKKCEELVGQIQKGDEIEINVTDTETGFPLATLVNRHLRNPLITKLRPTKEEVLREVGETLNETADELINAAIGGVDRGRDLLAGFLRGLAKQITPPEEDGDDNKKEKCGEEGERDKVFG